MARVTPGDGEVLFVVSKVDRVAMSGGFLTVSLEGMDGARQTVVLSTSVAVDGVSRVQAALLGGKVVPWAAARLCERH